MATVERRAATELRLEGSRTLSGPAVTYGEIATGDKGPERFEARAFRSGLDTAPLVLQHDRSRVLVERPAFTDSALRLSLRARLPADGAEARLVRRGALRGLSVGFVALLERQEDGVRVIQDAHLDHVALVDRPAYGGSVVELRQLEDAAIVSVLPYGRSLECQCQGPECGAVRFEPGAFDEVIENAISGKGHDILAIAGRASEVLGSLRRGTFAAGRASGKALELVGALEAKIDAGLEIVYRKAVTAYASAVIGNALGAPLFVRPVIRLATSEFVDQGGIRTFRKADVRAFLFKPTATAAGLIPAVVEGKRTGALPEAYEDIREVISEQIERRYRLWL